MIKLFFILTAAVTLVAVIFGYQNRQALIKARTEKDQNNAKIKTELTALEGTIDEVVAMQGFRKRAEGERDEQQELLISAKRKLSIIKSEAQALDAQLKRYQDEFNDLKEQLKDLPEGVTLQTLEEDINRKKQTLADKQADLAALEKEIEVMNDNHERANKTLAGKVEQQARRNKSCDVNSLEATVTAVNRDWGFVIVDAGSEAGITIETPLLVARNSEPIGKLRIISLEPQTLVADIDFDTVVAEEEFFILPGDTVVLEKPNQ